MGSKQLADLFQSWEISERQLEPVQVGSPVDQNLELP